jgi:hypothetical protein
VLRTFDFQLAALLTHNSDLAWGRRVFAYAVVGSQWFVPLLVALPGEVLPKREAVFLLLPAVTALAAVYARWRRRQIAEVEQSLRFPLPLRMRAVLFFVLFLTLVGSAVAAAYSALLSAAFVLVMASLPWQRWAGPGKLKYNW